MAYNDEVIKLLLDMGVSKDNVQEVSRKLDELDSSAKKAAGSTANLGQTALQGGRALQDFAQGGIGGVLNNIEGLVGALGYGPGLAGVMTAVGLAAYFAIPKLKEWWSAIFDGTNDVPKATDKVEGLKDALNETTKALEGLKDKHNLTNAELARFNELTAEQTRLQKDLAEATRKRKEAEQVAALKPFGQAEAEQFRAGGMQGMFGGNAALRNEAVDAATNRFVKEWEANQKRINELQAQHLAGQGTDASRRELDERARAAGGLERAIGGPARGGVPLAQHARDRLREMLNHAIATGDEQAMRGIIRFLPGPGFGPGGGIRGDMETLLPEAMAQQEAEIAAMEDRAQQLHGAGQARRAQGKARADAAKQVQKQIADAVRRKFDQSTEESRRRAARDAEAKAEEQQRFRGRVKAGDVAYGEAKKEAFDTDIDEEAVIEAARIRAAGGDFDKFGRFHQLDKRGQDKRLQYLIDEALKKRFPQMGMMNRAGIASDMSHRAGKQVDQALSEAQAQAMQAGVNTQRMMLQALANLTQRYQQIVRQNQEQQRVIRRLDSVTTQHLPSAACMGW